MVNITLILLLLHYIGLYIFKPKLDTLNCGIGGYIGNNFNKYKFNILGIYNDLRGGDSCGIFINNNGVNSVHYGHDKTKLYKNFVECGELKDVNLETPNFALLHCRKASVGGISLATAQPVVIRDEHNEIVFSMIHNGTLVNYKELANKYDVDFTFAETDSQIFCKIVYKAGYKVLAEYDGAGAFVFWDKRDGSDTIKIFKGASLYYEDDVAIYIERPLYCIQEENSYWFSSISESLDFINDTNAKVKNVPDNILFTIKNGKIIAEDKIDRSKRKQVDKLTVNWEKKRAEEAKAMKRFIPNNQRCDDYYGSDYDSCWGYDDENHKNVTAPISESTTYIENPIKIKDKISFCPDGLYYLNGALCEGRIETTPAGYISASTNMKEIYYFVCGVIMSSYFDYLCAKQFVCQNFESKDDECLELYLAAFSPTPVPWIMVDSKESTFIEFYEYNSALRSTQLVSGAYEPFFNFNDII